MQRTDVVRSVNEDMNMLGKLNQISSMTSSSHTSKKLLPGSSTIRINEAADRYAVKIIRARDIEYQRVALKEYGLLRSLNHPGIIKMVDAYVNNGKETIYLVMDLVDGLSLK